MNYKYILTFSLFSFCVFSVQTLPIQKGKKKGGWGGGIFALLIIKANAFISIIYPIIIHLDCLQRKFGFCPKGTAILQIKNFPRFFLGDFVASPLGFAMQSLILPQFATQSVAQNKSFGFADGSSFLAEPKVKQSFTQPIFFCFAFSETWKR